MRVTVKERVTATVEVGSILELTSEQYETIKDKVEPIVESSKKTKK